MNAYSQYVLTVGNIEASLLASEGTEEYIETLLNIMDDQTVNRVQRLRIEATKHVLAYSRTRKDDLENIESIYQELIEVLDQAIVKVKRNLQ